MKKLIVSLVCLLSIFAFISPVYATEDEEVTTTESEKSKVNVYIFTKDGCHFCESAKTFLKELAEDKEYGEMFELVEIQVWDSNFDADDYLEDMMNSVAEVFDDEIGGAPYIVVGKTYSVNGYEESLNDEIKAGIKEAYEDENYVDLVEKYKLEHPEKEKSNTGAIVGIIVTIVIIAGLVALVIFSRKSEETE